MTFIDGKWRQSLHLEPPAGWLNDPNGLCFFAGYYHVYFQYAPDCAEGSGIKCWGHYRSKDLQRWEFTGTVLFPDTPYDKDGVYSGSGIVWEDTLHLFYTGNVKEEGEHDYVTSGRGANVIHVTTKDGVTMSPKEIVLRNSDYPAFCSCHVRDPKVWRENARWYMVLGARTLQDEGCVLFYSSENLEEWTYEGSDRISDFGYMWECPDVFYKDGWRYLSVSPQGLPHGEAKYQNVYQSGYFQYDTKLQDFTEWDMGFDFYAPQTFETPDGRRILIGWMGIGDIPYTNPTTALGYQHCLTIPREITRNKEGKLLQKPIREFENLRGEKENLQAGESRRMPLPFVLEARVEEPFVIEIEEGLRLSWDGIWFQMEFTKEDLGSGRDIRKAKLTSCAKIELIADKSSVEVYLDEGRTVLSSRMYPREESITLTVKGMEADLYPLRKGD